MLQPVIRRLSAFVRRAVPYRRASSGLVIEQRVISSWEEAGGWDAPETVERYRQAAAAFSVAQAMRNPVVRATLECLGAMGDQHSVLDVGCAFGNYRPLLSSFAPTRMWSYSGADVSPGIIALCRELHPGLDFHVIRDGVRVPVRDKSFDVVLASGVLHYVREWRDALREYRRIARAHVLMTRLPVAERGAPVEQLVRRTGSAPERHVFWVFQRAELERTIDGLGFRRLRKGTVPERFEIEGIGSVTGSFYLVSV